MGKLSRRPWSDYAALGVQLNLNLAQFHLQVLDFPEEQVAHICLYVDMHVLLCNAGTHINELKSHIYIYIYIYI